MRDQLLPFYEPLTPAKRNGSAIVQMIRENKIAPTDPNVSEEDVPRLTGQNLAILNRLREGPATNVELAEIALKYSGRISDVRAAGYRIKGEKREGGVWVYSLEAKA